MLEQPIVDLDYFPRLQFDQNCIGTIADPFKAGRRNVETEKPEVRDTVLVCPEWPRQNLAEAPLCRRGVAANSVGPLCLKIMVEGMPVQRLRADVDSGRAGKTITLSAYRGDAAYVAEARPFFSCVRVIFDNNPTVRVVS